MSLAALTAVFHLTLEPKEKLVALALADHADPAGENMYPSIERLGAMASLSPRSVQRALRGLLEAKLIVRVAEASRYKPTEYRFASEIMTGRGDNLTPLMPAGVTKPSRQGCQTVQVMGDSLTPEPTPKENPNLELTTTPLTPPLTQGGLPMQIDSVDPRKPKTWAHAKWGTPEALGHLWNVEAPDNVPTIDVMSPGRRKNVLRRLKENPEREFWVQVLRAYNDSRFLSGRSKPSPGHENFRPDFDWLMGNGKHGTENCVKVYDGAYGNAE